MRGRHSRQGIPAGRVIIWGQQLGGVGELVSLSVIARAGEAGSRAGSQPGLRHPHHHWEQEHHHHHQPHQLVEADIFKRWMYRHRLILLNFLGNQSMKTIMEHET